MIILNNVKFAESENEMINSLFDKDVTCSGYAKRHKRKIELFNIQHELIGVINKHGVLCNARKLDNGKYWYSYSQINIIGEFKSYRDEVETVEKLRVSSDKSGNIYK